MRLFLGFLSILLLFVSTVRAEEFLEPEKAFQVKAQMVSKDQVRITYTIADAYYLYRERLKFGAQGAELGAVQLPAGKIKFDETFQKDVETYHHELVVLLPVKATADFQLKLELQGCAEAGLCYPPMELTLPVALADIASDAGVMPQVAQESGEQSSIADALKSGRLSLIIPLFLLLGLGLSLTPCVLPMVPILSFIIVGEGAAIKRSRGFFLSLSYVLGMALVYTSLGVAAGLLGEGLSAALQNPWVLSAFALLMIGLSLSMFGVYQLQMPAAIQTRLTYFSEGQRNGKMAGVFLMGAISALIVGPCVAAPLAGALVYISQTKDVVVGGTALFFLAMGMGVPLLLVGISAGSLLPRAGVWMEQIKRFFGVLMLAMAIWMVSPVLPPVVQMIAWAILLLGYGIYQLAVYRGKLLSKLIAIIFVLAGGMQLLGVATGGRDALAPIAHLTGSVQHVKFQRIKSSAELDAVLAQSNGKIVMLDFYADWCVSCKEMEKLTFVEPRVKAQLDQILLLQVDVTANNADDKALLKRFGLFGPPGIIFFGAQGKEISNTRVIGYQNADKFLNSLQKLK
ncbi:protein-disulfide reductase DsbD [Undibacterium seohonense]|uniref:Thiol:disulfide interchange protein DsbD n=1 Tax=Undibacterium seohonense TaxID=1344950 RepID=A0ABR6X189_9BURK|nr:protein-disulfide reductase DsbD [Undibacterium seohonense]MBC3806423.1 protein-disulfide reductase DsbD [Undibacterium seohonense]